MALKWFGRKKKDKEQAPSTPPAAPTESTPPSAAASEADALPDLVPEPEPAAAEPPKKRGLFGALKAGLSKTSKLVKKAFQVIGGKLDDDALEEIESSLIQADFGPRVALELTDALRDAYSDKEFKQEELVPFLKDHLKKMLGEPKGIAWSETGTTVILVTGVNGTGKTTSIAKLAKNFQQQGKRVLVAAGDTFRAAAVQQLGIWSERLGIDMVAGDENADPAAVVYDALEAAQSENYDVLIIDTAGRLHTQVNLMNQLEKIFRVIQKQYPEAPHEVIQVLDATTGQNAIRQAQEFKKAVQVSGLVLTKLDGTAKGGVIFPILREIQLPVKYIGVGEGIDDLQVFNPDQFISALFDEEVNEPA
ncbi:MAG: signal recognition particle-docking protein FtsY [Planctomycetota bacterium]